jgi:hypothetical protein
MLNRDVICCIFMNMGALDVIRARTVCKDWRTAYDKIYEMYAEGANRLLNTHCDMTDVSARYIYTNQVNLCNDLIYGIYRSDSFNYDGDSIAIERRTICPVLSIRMYVLAAHYDTFSALSALTLDSISSGSHGFECVVGTNNSVFCWTLMTNHRVYITCKTCNVAYPAKRDGEFILELVKYMLSPDIRIGAEIMRHCKYLISRMFADTELARDHTENCSGRL